MVVIRLARSGAKKRPFYKLVVADSRKSRDKKFIERVGFYNPYAPVDRENLRINLERIDYWKNNGAKLSQTVSRLIKQVGRRA